MQNPDAYNANKHILPPLAFVSCGRDALPTVFFAAETPSGSFYFQKDRIGVEITSRDQKAAAKTRIVLELSFSGAREDVAIKGEGEHRGTLNYVIGGNAPKWRPDLLIYEKLKYEGIWDGVDLELFGDTCGLKFNWMLKKADAVRLIRLHWEGIDGISLSEEGSLLIRHSLVVLADTAPTAWQTIRGRKQKVGCAYCLLGERDFGFALFGDFDPDLPLIIDPVIPCLAL
jgi:hypothetical protein